MRKLPGTEKIHVIPLGFDLTKFTQNNEQKRKQFRKAYQINDDTVLISITGRLAPVKNHRLFIEAIALLKQKTNIPFIVFVVGDGELMQEIQEFALQKGLTIENNPAITKYFNPVITSLRHYVTPQSRNPVIPLPHNPVIPNIIFTSWRKDIDIINAGSDIVALSSINEGTPVSIIEAMASGKAVLCTNVGGVADVVQHGVNGLLSSSNVVEYAEHLQGLIENEGLRLSLAANAQQSVLKKYSHLRLARDMENLYRNLLIP